MVYIRCCRTHTHSTFIPPSTRTGRCYSKLAKSRIFTKFELKPTIQNVRIIVGSVRDRLDNIVGNRKPKMVHYSSTTQFLE